MRLSAQIFTTALIALLMPAAAHAKVTQVGPQNFHKQIQLPNSIGRNNTFNNDDTYSGESARQNRHNRRQQRQRDRNKAASEEPRTQAESVTQNKRKGRRQAQSDAQARRIMQRQLQAQQPASTGVND